MKSNKKRYRKKINALEIQANNVENILKQVDEKHKQRENIKSVKRDDLL